MTPEQKYGQCSVKGCNNILMDLNGLYENITIGELKKYLNKRIDVAGNETIIKQRNLIESIVNKCFKIVYRENHIEIVYINDIVLQSNYGEIDAIMIGEYIVKYNAQIRFEKMTKEKKCLYSNYFECNENTIDFNIDEFLSLKDSIISLNNVIKA